MAAATPKEILDKLFPIATQGGTSFSPTQNPGVSLESAKALSHLLKENHERFHIFFNDRGFHKYGNIHCPLCAFFDLAHHM